MLSMNTKLMTQHTTLRQSYRQLDQALARLDPITLSEMADVSLLDRIDTKYLFPMSDLIPILGEVEEEYRILDINQVRLNQYHTVYFDEPDFTLYKQHHNKHADRYKVRARQYVDTNLAFFEVKHKTNKKRTIKSRLELNQTESQTDEVNDFIDTYVPVDSQQMEQKLWNNYLRLTLVGKSQPERVTIDLNLSFGQGDGYTDLPGMVIAEVKQSHFSQDSYFIQQMRKRGIRSNSFSKYCAGVCLLYDGVKRNNFKPVMQKVQKLVQEEANYGRLY